MKIRKEVGRRPSEEDLLVMNVADPLGGAGDGVAAISRGGRPLAPCCEQAVVYVDSTQNPNARPFGFSSRGQC